MASKKCYILAGDVLGHEDRKFPLSRSGWTAARNHILSMASNVWTVRGSRGVGYATLICPGGGIPLYQCQPGRGCAIEGSDGNDVLAGARKRRILK